MEIETILVIDDEVGIRKLLKTVLEKEAFVVHEAGDGISALELVQNKISITGSHRDITMPGMNGLETMQELRNINPNFPILFLTGQRDPKDIIGALNLGANDYITKPFSLGEVVARVKNHLRLLKKDKLLQEMLDIDDLTGLYNMRSIYTKIQDLLDHKPSLDMGLVMMDLDHFKQVNDKNDHLFGSYVLSEIGKIILHHVPAPHLAARYGGDEFLLIFNNLKQAEVFAKADELRLAIAANLFKKDNYELHLTVSMGLAMRKNGTEPEKSVDLVRRADFALYESKHAGRNNIYEKKA
jgi:diguanylate cyclase (GGDEF)-like protein